MKFDKSYWKSKTLWATVLIALSGFTPDIQKEIKEDPAAAMTIVSAIFGVLRLTTKKKLVVKEEKELK